MKEFILVADMLVALQLPYEKMELVFRVENPIFYIHFVIMTLGKIWIMNLLPTKFGKKDTTSSAP